MNDKHHGNDISKDDGVKDDKEKNMVYNFCFYPVFWPMCQYPKETEVSCLGLKLGLELKTG